MKQEKSCGAVIFREDDNGRRFYLILTSTKGHITLCKGHVEHKEPWLFYTSPSPRD